MSKNINPLKALHPTLDNDTLISVAVGKVNSANESALYGYKNVGTGVIKINGGEDIITFNNDNVNIKGSLSINDKEVVTKEYVDTKRAISNNSFNEVVVGDSSSKNGSMVIHGSLDLSNATVIGGTFNGATNVGSGGGATDAPEGYTSEDAGIGISKANIDALIVNKSANVKSDMNIGTSGTPKTLNVNGNVNVNDGTLYVDNNASNTYVNAIQIRAPNNNQNNKTIFMSIGLDGDDNASYVGYMNPKTFIAGIHGVGPMLMFDANKVNIERPLTITNPNSSSCEVMKVLAPNNNVQNNETYMTITNKSNNSAGLKITYYNNDYAGFGFHTSTGSVSNFAFSTLSTTFHRQCAFEQPVTMKAASKVNYDASSAYSIGFGVYPNGYADGWVYSIAIGNAQFAYQHGGKGCLGICNVSHGIIKYTNDNIELNRPVSYGSSLTITHLAPCEDAFERFELGKPVFMSGKVYKQQYNNDVRKWIQSNSNDSQDCISSVRINGTWRSFLGVCVELDIKNRNIKFATHGDFMFKVNDSSKYSVGDVILYDGTKLGDDDPFTTRIKCSCIGKVTAVMDSNHVAVFKD